MPERLNPSGDDGIKIHLMVMIQPNSALSEKELSMRVSRVIKGLHCLVTLMLLLLVIFFISVNHTDTPRTGDELQHRYKINDSLWLYTTINREGNATVPMIYRFYLFGEITGNNDVVINTLKNTMPFLAGNGSISKITSDGKEHISIIYSGKVYSLSDTTSYSIDGRQADIHISYTIN